MNNPEFKSDSFLVIDFKSGNKQALVLLVERWHKKLCEGDPSVLLDGIACALWHAGDGLDLSSDRKGLPDSNRKCWGGVDV